jgi:hypothetical protein
MRRISLDEANQLPVRDLYLGQIAPAKFGEEFAIGNLFRGGIDRPA